jgi:hypothetical protein
MAMPALDAATYAMQVTLTETREWILMIQQNGK